MLTALLGGKAPVVTPTGRVELTIPAETQQGKVFRLRGQGMPKLKSKSGERGDLLARANVVLPTNLTDREKALLEELRTSAHRRSTDDYSKPTRRNRPDTICLARSRYRLDLALQPAGCDTSSVPGSSALLNPINTFACTVKKPSSE